MTRVRLLAGYDVASRSMPFIIQAAVLAARRPPHAHPAASSLGTFLLAFQICTGAQP